MVSLNGAKECPPLVAQIDTLTAAIAQLETAIAANGLITFIQFNYLEGPAQTTISISHNQTQPDSAAIFNDVRNILDNQKNILTNELGAIT